MRHNTLYAACCDAGVAYHSIWSYASMPEYIYIPRMAQNRTGFEVAKEEEAEKMRGRRKGKRRIAAAVKERLGYEGGDKGRQ